MQIIAANSAGAINAATYDGVLYGYPMTADNGYFLYYDKSVLTEEDVQTLDGILAAAEKAGKKVQHGRGQRLVSGLLLPGQRLPR